MSKKMQSNILLLLTAIIWGSAFVAQKSGMDYVEPFTFNGIRTFIGGLVLIPVIFFMEKKNPPEEISREEKTKKNKELLIGGICCGLALFAASSLQQFGVSYTTAGKAGFITTLYVVFVPIISVLLRKKVRPIMWLCVAMGAVGLYLLCMTDASFRLTFGDTLVLLCAVAFAVHILTVDHFSPKMDGIKLSCIQFLTVGIVSMVCMFIFEHPDIHAILDCAVPLLYAGVLSCGLGFTFQVVAQKHAEPTVASLLMSLESVFGVLGGWLVLGEIMNSTEILGCCLMLAGMLVTQAGLLLKKTRRPIG